MKKRGLFTLVIMVVLCCVMVTVGTATDETTDQTYTIDTPHEYPILPGTPEWAALPTHMAMLSVCQIPEDILHAMTTEALVETVINYPLTVDLYAYSTFEVGYEKVKGQFNGLRELESRPDALAVLSQKMTVTMNLEDSDKSLKDFWTENLYSTFFKSVLRKLPLEILNQMTGLSPVYAVISLHS